VAGDFRVRLRWGVRRLYAYLSNLGINDLGGAACLLPRGCRVGGLFCVRVHGQEFRIETEVFADSDRVIAKSLTLFDGKMTYDFLMTGNEADAEPSRFSVEEVVVFDQTKQRIVLLDQHKQQRLELGHSEVLSLVAGMQSNEALRARDEFLLEPKLTESFDTPVTSTGIGQPAAHLSSLGSAGCRRASIGALLSVCRLGGKAQCHGQPKVAAVCSLAAESGDETTGMDSHGSELRIILAGWSSDQSHREASHVVSIIQQRPTANRQCTKAVGRIPQRLPEPVSQSDDRFAITSR
jgi:hypothetical protein